MEVKGEVAITKPVKVPPFGSTKVKGIINARDIAIVESPKRGFSDNIVTTNTYTVLKPGSCQVI